VLGSSSIVPVVGGRAEPWSTVATGYQRAGQVILILASVLQVGKEAEIIHLLLPKKADNENGATKNNKRKWDHVPWGENHTTCYQGED